MESAWAVGTSSIVPAAGGADNRRNNALTRNTPMLISVVNRSQTLTDARLQAAVRAVNRQLEEDFWPHWQFGARLRVDSAGRVPGQHLKKVATPTLPGRRGDAVLY